MTPRHFIRNSWLTTSYYVGLTQLYNQLAGRRKGVLAVHNILPIPALPPYESFNIDLTAEIFNQQMHFLTKKFNFRPIDDLEKVKEGFFVTVDDGMLNNSSTLAPILEKYGLTAMFAVCPDMIDKKAPFIWRDHIFLILFNQMGKSLHLPINNYQTPYSIKPEGINLLTLSIKRYVYLQKIANPYQMINEILEKNGLTDIDLIVPNKDRFCFMGWPEIIRLSSQGHRIASHTMSHKILTFLSNAEKRYEIERSKIRLEQVLGIPIYSIVYPYGSMAEVDEDSMSIAKLAGYQSGFMNISIPVGINNTMGQGRFSLARTTSPAHLHAVASGYKQLFK